MALPLVPHRPAGRVGRAGRVACLWLLFLWAVLPAQAQEALEVYELNYSRGAMAFGLGNYEQAETFFRAALEAKPDDPEASNYLGQSLLRRKQYAEAEALFRRMLA
nr:tetratricopeptide repeat protein [Nitrospirota bacterium]